jgi:hypothetical protein
VALARRFQTQYRRLVRHAGERCLVFCQVGRFVEFRGPQRIVAQRTLGLRPAYLPRAGYGLAVGFPMRLLGRYTIRALKRGFTVVEVRERPALSGVGTARVPTQVLVPMPDPGRIGGSASDCC